MTSSRRKPTNKVTKTAKKMATLAGSLAAVGTMQADSRAEILHFNTSPVTAAFSNGDNYQVGWDVDDDGEADSFLSVGFDSVSGAIEIAASNSQIYIGTDGDDAFERFAVSESVGRSVGNWLTGGGTGSGNLISFNTTYGTGYHLDSAASENLLEGDNYIGFRFYDFEDSENYFYGWANLNLDLTTGTVTITEWAYEDTADTVIHVADVPEPSSLALLAMGAGGLFAYRARRKKRSAEVTV